MKKVMEAFQGSINKSNWFCKLECGHELWVHSKTKPTIANCPECEYPMVPGEGAPQYTFALPDEPTQLSLL